MQRVHEPVGVDRAARRDQRLARDLAAEDALAVLVGADAAEEVDFELLELEQVDEIVERASHGRGDATGAPGAAADALPEEHGRGLEQPAVDGLQLARRRPRSARARRRCPATRPSSRSRPRGRRRSPRCRSGSRSHGRTRSGCRRGCTWPSAVVRASKPVRCSISSARRWPIPPRRTWPNSSSSPVCSSIVPSFGVAPSAATTIEKFAPCWWRCLSRSQTSSMSNGSSGIKMMSAPPAMPGVRRDPTRVPAHHLDDHHPVVALGGGVQAVDRVGRGLHRGVEAEGEVGRREVVVDRLRHADDVHAVVAELRARRRACPRRRSRSARRSGRARASRAPGRGPSSVLYGLVRDVPRIVPPRGSSPRTRPQRQVHRLALDRHRASRGGSRRRVAVVAHALAHDGPDHRVQTRAIAAAGQHPDPHGRLLCLPYPAASAGVPGVTSPVAADSQTSMDTPAAEPLPIPRLRRAPRSNRRGRPTRAGPAVATGPVEPIVRRLQSRIETADPIVAWTAAGSRARCALHRRARRPHPRLRGADRALALPVSTPGSSPAGRAAACTRPDSSEITSTRHSEGARTAAAHRVPQRPRRCWLELRVDAAPTAFADALVARDAHARTGVSCVIAIDAGTTGVRSFAVGADGVPQRTGVPRVPAALPAAGLGRARRRRHLAGHARDARRGRARSFRPRARRSPRSASRTSARRSWSGTGAPGAPRRRAIVWQDRRTAERCDELRAAGHEPMIRRAHRPRARPVLLGVEALVAAARRAASTADADLVFGTVDTWLLWNLTGGPDGGVHATDPSNASRTMLYDIGAARLVGRAVRAVRRAARVPARGAAVERTLRHHRSRARGRARGCR